MGKKSNPGKAMMLKCIMGHRDLTQALSDDVSLRKPPLGQQEEK